MDSKIVHQLEQKYPLIKDLKETREVFWLNPNYTSFDLAKNKHNLGEENVKEAEKRLKRFAPYLAKAFPETAKTKGIIESPALRIPNMKKALEEKFRLEIPCDLVLKCDNQLPISGSIKARGGIYEVLVYAEKLALKNRLITVDDDYSAFDSESFRRFFSQYSISVGSTGNLGLSIGIMGAKMGFQVFVHMSADAREWKKALLREKGVKVIEYETDYSHAVKKGREQAENNPKMHFVDDENSKDLFLGYAVAPFRLKEQLESLNILVDDEHPLFVFLPCGVGGGPGGVTFGLKLVYKDNVHCFFAEPTHSPCMLLGMMTGLHDKICVQDLGIDNKTEADGLAVGRASAFVGRTLENHISGLYTVQDDELFILLSMLMDSENIKIEPSAAAGLAGFIHFFQSREGQDYLKKHNLTDKINNATFLAWATGGNMVPDGIMKSYYEKGRFLFDRGF